MDEVHIGWDAYVADPNGQRLATNVTNGIPVPHVGDQIVLFLRPLDRAGVDFMGGFATHGPVSLDRVAFAKNGIITITDRLSGDVIGLRGRTIAEIADLVVAS